MKVITPNLIILIGLILTAVSTLLRALNVGIPSSEKIKQKEHKLMGPPKNLNQIQAHNNIIKEIRQIKTTYSLLIFLGCIITAFGIYLK